jgi:uncharacterized phage protein (TIGR01671 family)
MREIKFRAWMNEKMYEPAVVFSPTFELTDDVVEQTRLANKEGWVLMQFTGLHDKNGKEIYEGDIVRGGTEYQRKPYNTLVKWDDGLAGFSPFVDYDSDCSEYYATSQCEIIGNIYENSDLLK